jgi:hypothetical protein
MSAGEASGSSGGTFTTPANVSSVELSGSWSIANGHQLTEIKWKVDGNQVCAVSTCSVELGYGAHTVVLEVHTSQGISGTASATVVVTKGQYTTDGLDENDPTCEWYRWQVSPDGGEHWYNTSIRVLICGPGGGYATDQVTEGYHVDRSRVGLHGLIRFDVELVATGGLVGTRSVIRLASSGDGGVSKFLVDTASTTVDDLVAVLLALDPKLDGAGRPKALGTVSDKHHRSDLPSQTAPNLLADRVAHQRAMASRGELILAALRRPGSATPTGGTSIEVQVAFTRP